MLSQHISLNYSDLFCFFLFVVLFVRLLLLLYFQAEDNLGMAMIYSIIAAVQEQLTVLMEQSARKEEEEVERKRKVLEESERVRLHVYTGSH